MRIGIDARFYGPVGKGLGRYTQKLIENLEKIYLQNKSASGEKFNDEYFVFLGRENFHEYVPKNPNFHKILADCKWYTFSEQLKMPGILNKFNLDLVHFLHFNVPFFYRKKFLVTIHDLILLEFPTVKSTTLNPLFYRIKFWAYKFIIWSAIQRARKIITVSNFTRNELLKYYKKDLAEEKISLTYEAADDNTKSHKFNQLERTELFKKYGIIKPYLLYVGNAYPHKNLERLVLAFSKLKLDQNYHLVLVGKTDYFYERLKQMVKKNHIEDVIFLGQVTDEVLDLVYQEASAYIFASLYEGFGLPPLEAMTRSIPVISSDHPCMKEILGDSAYFFNGNNENEITSAMEKILKKTNLRNSLIQKGLSQVKKYSWIKMAKETRAVYLKINEKK